MNVQCCMVVHNDTDRQTDRLRERDRQTDIQTDRQTDRLRERDRQRDIQTDRETDNYTVLYGCSQ